jgi:multidrug efflux pump subunit AcrA (membrane-fusion protein)
LLSTLLVLGFLGGLLALVFVPWRQAVSGDGRVIGFSPLDRQQAIESPITGRVMQWFVQEGSKVKKGDPIARLADNDPDYLTRLKDQEEAVKAKIAAANQEVQADIELIDSLAIFRDESVAAAEKEIEGAKQKIEAEKAKVGASQIGYETDRMQFDRIAALANDKQLPVASVRDYELARQKVLESLGKLNEAKANQSTAEALLMEKTAGLNAKRADAESKIRTARAYLAKARVSIGEYEKELQEVQAKIARQTYQLVKAPRDGTILRLEVPELTSQVYEADPIAIFVPDAPELAVELQLHGNDAPLVEPGRHVRLQFEGWPAIQFVGYPSIAVGTFGGTVVLVDASDHNGDGTFRVLVKPENPDAWPIPGNDKFGPGRIFLRQGVRAKGWVLLDQVSLGYELWRRVNGFPPSIQKADSGEKGKDDKADKKPKVKRPKA